MKLTGIILAAVLVSSFLLYSSLPLGVPDEWVWPRQAFPEDLGEWLDRFLLPILFSGAALAFCRFADGRISRSGWMMKSGLVFALVIVAFCWQRMAIHAASSPHRELRLLWVLYDKYASGYFFSATFHPEKTAEILRGYEAKMAEGDVLHEGTHPPGLLLLNRSALAVTDAWPGLEIVQQCAVSPAAIRLFRELERDVGLARPLTRSELTSLCLVSLVTSMFCATAVIPVFLLVARIGSFQTAWRAACLSFTAPGITMFLPRSDVLYVASGAWLLLLIVLAVSERSPMKQMIWSTLGAMVLALCLFVSLAHLPVLLAGGLFGLMAWWKPSDSVGSITRGRLLTVAGVAAVSFFAVVLVFNRYTDCNLWKVWGLNLRNHENFYSSSVRTWWKWALVNPFEFGMATGLPVAAVACLHLINIAIIWPGDKPQLRWTPVDLLSLSFAVTWACLWLSGKNMGEAARLWCFMTPWAAMIASAGLGSRESCGSQLISQSAVGFRGESSHGVWLTLLASQFTVCLLTTGFVSGYLEM